MGPRKRESLKGGSILKDERGCTQNHPNNSLVLEIIQIEIETYKEEIVEERREKGPSKQLTGVGDNRA